MTVCIIWEEEETSCYFIILLLISKNENCDSGFCHMDASPTLLASSLVVLQYISWTLIWTNHLGLNFLKLPSAQYFLWRSLDLGFTPKTVSKILMSQLFLLQLNKIFKQLQLSVLLSESSHLI